MTPRLSLWTKLETLCCALMWPLLSAAAVVCVTLLDRLKGDQIDPTGSTLGDAPCPEHFLVPHATYHLLSVSQGVLRELIPMNIQIEEEHIQQEY